MLKKTTNDQNKIARKLLRPYLLGLAVGIPASIASIVLITTNPDKLQNPKNQSTEQPAVAVGAFGVIILLAVVGYFYFKKSLNKSLVESMTKYVEKLMTYDPEMREFKDILDNPNAMKRIANFISNELPDAEQNKIASIIKEINNSKAPETLQQKYDQIVAIIENYAKKYPEKFLDELYAVLDKETFPIYCSNKLNNVITR